MCRGKCRSHPTRQLYKFLATVDGEVSADHVEAVMEFLTTESYVSMLKYCMQILMYTSSVHVCKQCMYA